MYIGIDGEKEPELLKREPYCWERLADKAHKVPSRAVSVKPSCVRIRLNLFLGA